MNSDNAILNETRCFICHSNFTTDKSGICYMCSNGETLTLDYKSVTSFEITRVKTKNLKKKSDNQHNFSSHLNNKKAEKSKILREAWNILRSLTAQYGSVTKRQIRNETGYNEFRMTYLFRRLRPYLDLERKKLNDQYWSVKPEYMDSEFEEICD